MTHLHKIPAILMGALIALSWPAYGDRPHDVEQSGGDGHATTAASGGTVVRAGTPEKLIAAMVAAGRTGQPVTIILAPGHYRFSRRFESRFGASALPPVTTTIAILGTDSATTIFDAGELGSRILTVLGAGNLRVRGVTITGGVAECPISSEPICAQVGGGAVANIGGTLWLEHCVMSGNVAYQTSGQSIAYGGAILSTAGHLYLDHTTVSANSVAGVGGGLALTGGTANIRHSIISGNVTRQWDGEVGTNFGGGIYITRGRLTIVGSTIAGNSAGERRDPSWLGFGAGIYNGGGSVLLKDSAVTENNIPYSAGSGGGIVNGGTMIIETSTIGGNSAGTSGGGIFNGGNLTLQGVTVVHNDVRGGFAIGGYDDEGPYPPGCRIRDNDLTAECVSSGGGIWNDPAAIIRVASSVIAGNEHAGNGPDCDGVLISEGHNALGVDTNCKLKPTRINDQVNLDPGIGELRDEGEPGNAHYPLLADSPLIDTGGKDCSPRDQLNHRRADGDGDGEIQCDVGAIEFHKH